MLDKTEKTIDLFFMTWYYLVVRKINAIFSLFNRLNREYGFDNEKQGRGFHDEYT